MSNRKLGFALLTIALSLVATTLLISVNASNPYDIWGPDGVPDGKVDLRDLFKAASAFGTTPQSPKWFAPADVNIDGKVDILDIVLIAANLGK